MNEKIIIVGDDGINSLGLLRSLGEMGYKSDLVITTNENKATTANKSKYVKDCFIIKKDSEVLLEFLMDYGKEEEKVYLFPTSDFVLKFLSDNCEQLSTSFIFTTISSTVGTLSEVMSKTVMAEYAQKAGFCIPKMLKYTITPDYLADENLYNYFSDCYPLILKADSIFQPGCDFIIVRNKEELNENLEDNIGKTIIIQQYIENAEELAIQGVAFGNLQDPHVFGAIHKKRTSLFAMGTTTYAQLKVLENGALKTSSEKFAELLGLSGIYDLDILLKDNKAFFIECNFRNGSNGYAYKKFGANLPYLWIKGLQAAPNSFNAEQECSTKEITFVNDIGDFAHLVHHNISVFKWIWQYITADAHLTFNLKDQGPFWAEFNVSRIKKLFK